MIEDFLTTYTAQELSKMGRTAVNEVELDGNPTYKNVRPPLKETMIEGEIEADSVQSLPIGRKRGEHSLFKSTSKGMVDRLKLQTSNNIRSRSPSINGSARTRVLFDQDLANSKLVRNIGDKSSLRRSAAYGERLDKENDSVEADKLSK